MANIILTNYCNLKCPYCFASEMMTNKQANEIEINELIKILNWLEKSPNEKRIGLIGGEPTLHSNFKEILKIVNNFCEITGKNSILFTNGIYLEEYLKYISPKMSILLNINTPEAMTQEQYCNLIKVLDLLYKKQKLTGENSQVTCGCNLCLEINNYNFFWEIIDKYQISKVRVSVTAPDETKKLDKEKYYSLMKNTFLSFLKEAKKRKVFVNIDCNHIPICYFSLAEQDLIKEVCNKDEIYLNDFCEPCIDITTDFKATSCFGIYDSLIDCNLFNNCDELRNYFTKKVISEKIKNNNGGKCNDCVKYKLSQCQGGCLSFSEGNFC